MRRARDVAGRAQCAGRLLFGGRTSSPVDTWQVAGDKPADESGQGRRTEWMPNGWGSAQFLCKFRPPLRRSRKKSREWNRGTAGQDRQLVKQTEVQEVPELLPERVAIFAQIDNTYIIAPPRRGRELCDLPCAATLRKAAEARWEWSLTN